MKAHEAELNRQQAENYYLKSLYIDQELDQGFFNLLQQFHYLNTQTSIKGNYGIPIMFINLLLYDTPVLVVMFCSIF